MDATTILLAIVGVVSQIFPLLLGNEPPRLEQLANELQEKGWNKGTWKYKNHSGNAEFVQYCVILRVRELYGIVEFLQALAVIYLFISIVGVGFVVVMFKNATNFESILRIVFAILVFPGVSMALIAVGMRFLAMFAMIKA
jgi:hypothetical protein